jgi:RNA polymerase sigma-70 factor (sigma-E family)
MTARHSSELVRRLTLLEGGDVDADDERRFRDFVTARTPTLMRIAYLLAGNQHDAQDLLQSALTRAAARYRWIRHDDPEAYVRRVLYREQISRWRRHSRRREVSTDPIPDQIAHDGTGGVDLRLSVRRALLALTPRQRAVLVLRYFEDRPEAEVADLLGCSIGTVRSQVAKAMSKFRAIAPELVP